ncbi:CENP-B protein [Artemisia annua]|uniref:CENP-B protein n=1 Tax=Artemisia annua TaxID=35608 RepID=A0A2U1NVG7_ARTAN|nr:CENP-B protein [Artemisia annua]
MNLAISAWTMDVRANTIANCFRHCKLRSTDNMTFENSDEGGESTQELQNLIKDLNLKKAEDDYTEFTSENGVLVDRYVVEDVAPTIFPKKRGLWGCLISCQFRGGRYGGRPDPTSIATSLLELTWSGGCKRTENIIFRVIGSMFSLEAVVNCDEEAAIRKLIVLAFRELLALPRPKWVTLVQGVTIEIDFLTC